LVGVNSIPGRRSYIGSWKIQNICNHLIIYTISLYFIYLVQFPSPKKESEFIVGFASGREGLEWEGSKTPLLGKQHSFIPKMLFAKLAG